MKKNAAVKKMKSPAKPKRGPFDLTARERTMLGRRAMDAWSRDTWTKLSPQEEAVMQTAAYLKARAGRVK